MPITTDPATHFVLKMVLRKALKLIPGLRKRIGEREEDVMASKLIAELALSGHKIVQEPGATAGFTFETPTGPGEER